MTGVYCMPFQNLLQFSLFNSENDSEEQEQFSYRISIALAKPSTGLLFETEIDMFACATRRLKR